jgi:membrane protein DedA with SNARE-associated domain
MTASIGDLAGHLLQELGYAGLVVLMAVEHVFPPIPSELVLPLAGFEVGRGNLSLAGALAASTAGSLIGASLLYVLARRGGRPLVPRPASSSAAAGRRWAGSSARSRSGWSSPSSR